MVALTINPNLAQSTIALCYIDPNTNTLNELNTESTTIKSDSFETTIRRFYLIGSDVIDPLKLTTLTVSLKGVKSEEYFTSVLAGQINPRVSDFTTKNNSIVFSYNQLDLKFDNAIPIDILIKSLSKTETINMLNIDITTITI